MAQHTPEPLNLQLQVEKLEREKAELLAALEDLVRYNYHLQMVKPETLETLQEIRSSMTDVDTD